MGSGKGAEGLQLVLMRRAPRGKEKLRHAWVLMPVVRLYSTLLTIRRRDGLASKASIRRGCRALVVTKVMPAGGDQGARTVELLKGGVEVASNESWDGAVSDRRDQGTSDVG